MTLLSFHRTADAEGWRYTLGWRARREQDGWAVERWNGTDWTPFRRFGSYAEAREARAWFDRSRHFGDAD